MKRKDSRTSPGAANHAGRKRRLRDHLAADMAGRDRHILRHALNAALILKFHSNRAAIDLCTAGNAIRSSKNLAYLIKWDDDERFRLQKKRGEIIRIRKKTGLESP